MTYIGDFRLGDTFDLKFCTVSTAGAPTTLAGTPAISCYPGNSTTEITAGITLTVDFDARTGMHNVRIVASSGNGYATATNYAVVITTGTVGGTSVVGYVVGHFSIENRSCLMPTTAARTLDVSSGGEAGVDWANVGSPTTTVTLSGTTVKTATDVESDTQDIQARLPAALVGGRIDANVGAISSDATAADNAEAFFDGTGYAGTNNVIPTVTTVNGLAANVITAAAINTGAITAAKFAAGAIDATAIASDAIAAAKIAAGAITAAKFASGAVDAAALAADAVAEIADGVWDEARAGHVAAGSFGEGVASVQGNVTGSVASVTGNVAGNVGGNVVGSIGSLATQAKADVNAEADAALADVGVTTTVTGRMDAAISTRLASAGYTAPDNAGIDAIEAAVAGLVTDVGTVDTVVDAIKAKTDSLTFTVAGNVDANAQYVNDVQLAGDGQGTPMGAA